MSADSIPPIPKILNYSGLSADLILQIPANTIGLIAVPEYPFDGKEIRFLPTYGNGYPLGNILPKLDIVFEYDTPAAPPSKAALA